MFSSPNNDLPRAARTGAGQDGRTPRLPEKAARRGAPGPGTAEAFRRRALDVAAGWDALRAQPSR